MARTLNVSNLYLSNADMTADSYDPELSADEGETGPSIFIFAEQDSRVDPLNLANQTFSSDHNLVVEFESWANDLYSAWFLRSTVIHSTSSLTGGTERCGRSLCIQGSRCRVRSKRSADRIPRPLRFLPPRRMSGITSPQSQITTRDAFQGSLLSAFDPEKSPEDQSAGGMGMISLIPAASTITSSPPLRKVTMRPRLSSDQLWQAARTVEMPTAGPVCLPAVKHSAGAPITGAKRQRSFSESLLTGELTSALKQLETDSPRQSLLQSLVREGIPALPTYLPSPLLRQPLPQPAPSSPISDTIPSSPKRSPGLHQSGGQS